MRAQRPLRKFRGRIGAREDSAGRPSEAHMSASGVELFVGGVAVFPRLCRFRIFLKFGVGSGLPAVSSFSLVSRFVLVFVVSRRFRFVLLS